MIHLLICRVVLKNLCSPKRTTLEAEQTQYLVVFCNLSTCHTVDGTNPAPVWFRTSHCIQFIGYLLSMYHHYINIQILIQQQPSAILPFLSPGDIRKKGMSTARKKCHKEWRKLHCSGVFDFLSETTSNGKKSICLK